VIRRLPLLLLVLTVLPAWAQEKPVAGSDLSGRVVAYDETTKEVVLTGDARFVDGDLLIEADEIRYQSSSGVAVATGHVRYTRGAERMLADSITYRRTDRSFALTDPRLGRYPYYISGTSASGTPRSVTVREATVTAREPGSFQPTVKAESLTYASDQTISAEKARVGIGHVQPISLPRFSHRLNLPYISYVSLTAGYRSSLGVYGEAGLHVPMGDETKLGGTLGVYTERGVMFGPSGHYEHRHAGRLIAGDFKSGFINDHGEKLTDILGRPVPENRGYVQWWHNQDLADRLTLTAQLGYWKDSEVVRDFHPQEFFPIQEPDSFIESTYTGNNYFVSAFARVQPNTYHRVQERLPELRFELSPHALGGGFYQRFNAGVAILREDPPEGGPRLLSDRLDAYYAVTRAFTPREWLGITPVAGGRVTHYRRATGGRDQYTRTLGEIGLDAELRGSAVFDYRNETWKIDGLRHLLTPRLSYRHVTDADKGRAYIPPVDRRTFMTYLAPLGLGDTRNIDELVPTNTLRLGFDNTLQTRDATYGSRDLLVFNAAADLRFDRAPGERQTSAIHTVVGFTPVSWLEFDLYQSFTPHDFTLQELNTGLTIRDGDAWALQFGSHFLRGQIEEYIVGGKLRWNEVYEVVARLHYDTRKRRFNEQAFGVRQNLHNTWIIEYLVTLYDGPRRESDFGFRFQVETLGF
jgi:LPS-assembly protein